MPPMRRPMGPLVLIPMRRTWGALPLIPEGGTMGGPLGRSVLPAALGPVPIPRGIDLGGDIHGRLLHHRLTWRDDRGHGFIPYGIMPRTDVSAERLSRTADDILPRHVSAPRGGRRFRLSGSAVRQGRDCQSSRRWPGGLAVSRRTGERPHRQKGKRHHERGCPFSRCGKHGTCADRHAVASMFVSHCTRTRHGVGVPAVNVICAPSPGKARGVFALAFFTHAGILSH